LNTSSVTRWFDAGLAMSVPSGTFSSTCSVLITAWCRTDPVHDSPGASSAFGPATALYGIRYRKFSPATGGTGPSVTGTMSPPLNFCQVRPVPK
jgi:hypothetical protein